MPMKHTQTKLSSKSFTAATLPHPIDVLRMQQSGELAPISAKFLYERLQQAMADRTNDIELSPAESQRFQENRTVIRRVKRELELRNYLLLEIHEAKQWRNQYQSLEEFAQIEAGIGESQLRKCIDSATVMIDMVEAGMEHIAPKGRQVEEVIKVPQSHRPEAWRHTLKVFERDGRSIDTTRAVLRDYCRDRDLLFGRRKPNGSKNIGLPSLMRIGGRILNKTRDARQKATKSNWVHNLSSSEKLVFSNLHRDTNPEDQNSNPAHGISVTKSVQIFTGIASTYANRETQNGMEAALNLLNEKDPCLANHLHHAALICLYDLYKSQLAEDLNSDAGT